MPIKLIALTCPNCGARLEIPADAKSFYCDYCDSHIYAENGGASVDINQTVSVRDEAELRRIEIAERKEREKQEEERALRERREARKEANRHYDLKRWLRLLVAYPVLFFAIFVGTAFLSAVISVLFEIDTSLFNHASLTLIGIYLFIGLPVWVVLLIVKRPKKGN